VHEDIARYAGLHKSEIAMHGIYFDRTPLEDFDDSRAYLKNISATVRHEEGFLEPRIVVHGAGAVPNANLTNYGADITVVFEQKYEDLPQQGEMCQKLEAIGGSRENYAYFVDSIPARVSRGGIRKIINLARRDVKWLFVTDQEGDGKYEKNSGRWDQFLSLTW
jgi:hypothetical protein